jgi:carboxymethylenebutenolidase
VERRGGGRRVEEVTPVAKHPGPVPMIHSEAAVIATEGTRAFEGHFARPLAGAGPGLLIFSEMWGVAAKKREMADDYARQGWCAMAPNMFWRSEFTGVVPFDQADKAWQRLQAFDFDQSAEDSRTAAAWLRRQPQCNGKIAAIGFCMGGRIAFLAASRAGVDAAIGLYALGIAKHLDEVRNVGVPLQLHYGLSDEHIPKSEIDLVAAAATGNPNIEIQLYPGAGHGFFNRTFSPDDEKAVETASAHIDRFLGRFK